MKNQCCRLVLPMYRAFSTLIELTRATDKLGDVKHIEPRGAMRRKDV